MNQGIEILLSRMESHPEEFEEDWESESYTITTASKWQRIIHSIRQRVNWEETDINHPKGIQPLPFLSSEEVTLVYEKWMSLQGPAFTKQVYKKLLEEKEKPVMSWDNATSGTYTHAMISNQVTGQPIASIPLTTTASVIAGDTVTFDGFSLKIK